MYVRTFDENSMAAPVDYGDGMVLRPRDRLTTYRITAALAETHTGQCGVTDSQEESLIFNVGNVSCTISNI